MVPALLAACSPAPPPADPRDPVEIVAPAAEVQPDVVLVLFESFRGAGGSLDGGERALLEGSGLRPEARFTAAYAQSTRPFPSLGSVFTGRYPSAVPICGLTPEGESDPGARPWCGRLPPARRTLAEVMGLYGYATAMFTSGLAGAESLAGGTSTHEAFEPLDDGTAPWDALGARATEWWEERAASPRLLVLVTSDLRVDDDEDAIADIAARTPGRPEEPAPRRGKARDGPKPQVLERPLDPVLLVEAYEERARRTGGRLRAFLEGLPGAPRPRWTFVAGTNGVTLGERTGWERSQIGAFHSDILLDRTTHVPLWSLGPEPAEATVEIDQPVELVDFFPTIAAIGGATPPAGSPGQDLRVRPLPSDEDAVAYVEFGDMLAVRQGRHLLAMRAYFHHGCSLDPELTRRLLDPSPRAATWVLHDVESDPWQRENVLAANIERFRSMRREMARLRVGAARPDPSASDPEHLWALRMTQSQGYW